MLPINSGAVTASDTVKWRITAVSHVESNPSARFKTFLDLVAKVVKPAIGSPATYRASYTITNTIRGYGGTTWVPMDWAPAKGVRAWRPTLAASDIGVQYFDTILDADGKPIWWTEAAWVDATGLAV